MSKPRLNLNEHEDLGRTLAVIHNELTRRYVQVANAYPLSGLESIPAKKINAALKALSEARCALDGAVFREHRDAAHPAIYYPATADRRTIGREHGSAEEHDYLSTGCLHGEHTYCENKTGQLGPKTPAKCKFCDARCICDCHGVHPAATE